MFGPPGRLYVYRSYGIHWCANVVCGAEGTGSAVLLRALEPTTGVGLMRDRRGVEPIELLCTGPGRLTQALGITGAHDGVELGQAPFELEPRENVVEVTSSARIGISRARDRPWRYALTGSRFVSRPRPRA